MPYKNPINGVYAIEAIQSKIVYVGSSNNVQLRMNLHRAAIKKADKKRMCKALYDAVQNGDTLQYVILEKCDNYLEREQYWISYLRSNGFNVVNVFDANRNQSQVPQAFRDKMSSVLKERWKDPEYREPTLERLKPTQFKKGSCINRVNSGNNQ